MRAIRVVYPAGQVCTRLHQQRYCHIFGAVVVVAVKFHCIDPRGQFVWSYLAKFMEMFCFRCG